MLPENKLLVGFVNDLALQLNQLALVERKFNMYKTGKVKWSKIDNTYWQKIFIGDSGQTHVTYHYKNKSAAPCIAIEIDTHISRQISGYSLIEKDLRDTILTYDEYLKLMTTKILGKDEILIKALKKAIVITYAKCFVGADGRNITLKEKVIPTKYNSTHKHLIEMRHQCVAHAGYGFEYSKNVLILPPQKKHEQGKIVQASHVNEISQFIADKDFDINTKKLLEDIHKHVKDKINSLIKIISDSINLIDPNELYKLPEEKGSRIVLNDEAFARLSHSR